MAYPIIISTTDLLKMNFYYLKKSSISRQELDEFANFVDQNLTEKNIAHAMFYSEKYIKELNEYFPCDFLAEDDKISLVCENECRGYGADLKRMYEGSEFSIIEGVMKDYMSKDSEIEK